MKFLTWLIIITVVAILLLMYAVLVDGLQWGPRRRVRRVSSRSSRTITYDRGYGLIGWQEDWEWEEPAWSVIDFRLRRAIVGMKKAEKSMLALGTSAKKVCLAMESLNRAMSKDNA